MKILYAAGNNANGLIQLARFASAMADTDHQVKVAAYRRSSPKNLAIDWTLDCLLDMMQPDIISLDNDNAGIYYEQVKYYQPDLIISDMEYFTSYIANALNISLWQCSSSLINFAAEDKQEMGLFTRYAYLLEIGKRVKTGRLLNMIDNSDRNLVYSHLGDADQVMTLKSRFEWIRPYHTVGKKSVPCQRNVVAGLLHNNKEVLALLKKYPDSVAFTPFRHERYTNLLLKDIGNQEEYFCNLKNCRLFLCEGQTSFLADAFYNHHYVAVLPDFEDAECVTNSIFSEHLGLSSLIYSIQDDIEAWCEKEVSYSYNSSVGFLHQEIEKL